VSAAHRSPATLQALDMRRLQTLQRVAIRGSFSQAAEELHFTQSAVSQQIAALERDLGLQLLNRSPVSLTEPGRMLCARYESAVAELAAAEAELESFRDGASGRMRMSAVGAAVSRIVPAAAAAFAERFPAVAVHIRQDEAREALARLRRGEADIALTFESEQPARSRPRVRWIRLTRERIAVALPASHPLARKPALQPGDLQAECFVHSPSSGISIEGLADALGGALKPSVVLAGENPDALLEMVAAGAGLALVPGVDVQGVPGVVKRPLVDPPLIRSIYAAVLDSARISAAVAAMLDELVASARRSSYVSPPERRVALRRASLS
jgi:DNA-binding transcriptional LysR family regulator